MKTLSTAKRSFLGAGGVLLIILAIYGAIAITCGVKVADEVLRIVTGVITCITVASGLLGAFILGLYAISCAAKGNFHD